MTNIIYTYKQNQYLYFTLNERAYLPNFKIELLNVDTTEEVVYDLPQDISPVSYRYNKYSFNDFEALNNVSLDVGGYIYYIYNYDATDENMIECGTLIIKDKEDNIPTLNTNDEYTVFE